MLLFLLLMNFNDLEGQTVYALEGRLFNRQDSSFVPASNIYTLPGKKGNMSDPNGYFYMEITDIDTLYVSTIGYKSYQIICAEIIEQKDFRIHIFLEPKIYELGTVNILGSMSYEEFKEELLDLPLAQDQIVDFDIPWEWYGYMDMPASGGFGVTFSGIFTGLYERHGKEGKQKEKIREVQEQQSTKNYIYSKYNPYVIQRATGIDDEEEIIRFMEYCEFSDYFIVNATQSELESALAKKYLVYSASKPKD